MSEPKEPESETALDHADGTLDPGDGCRLSWQRWLPAEPRGIVLLVHGLAEHAGRYAETAAWLGAHGWGVWALDLRGHGRSQGLSGHVDGFERYFADLGAVHGLVRVHHPSLPLFLLGHSMGGLIALGYGLAHPQDLAGVVVSSPALGTHPRLKPSFLLDLAARALSALAPRFRIATGIDPSAISHDEEVVRAYREDPLVGRKVSARWYTSIKAAQRQTREGAAKLALPALVMQSGGDLLIDPEATRRWAEAAPAGRVRFVEWPGFYHEMLNEPDKGEVFAEIDGWLGERLDESGSA